MPNKKTSDIIKLSPSQEKAFHKALKIGLYKDLHRKNLLTDAQLSLLLKLHKE